MTWFQSLRSHFAFRLSRRAVKLTIAILAAAFVASLTIDLGPTLRHYAERGGTAQLKRGIHIGRLSMHILRGSFILDDFSIDGANPGDRPFFGAKRLEIGLDWSGMLQRRPEIIVSSVEMTDWNMLVEKWQGRNNFPRFVNNNTRPGGPRRFTVTLKYLRAWRGNFTYEDHEDRWGIVAPGIDLNITNLPQYHGTATFKGGTVTIQDHLPMWADFRAAFVLDGPRVHLSRIDMPTDGAETTASGEVDFSRWPNMQFAVKSRVNFPRMREIFFTKVPDDAPKFATFSAKWDEGYRKKWGIKNGPAGELPEGVTDKLDALARTVGRVLKIRGPGRVDVRLTPGGELVVIEANPNPSLAHDEDFAQAALTAGIEYDALVQRILDDALRRPAGPHS